MAGEHIAALARMREAERARRPSPADYIAQAVGGVYKGFQQAKERARQESMDQAQLQIRRGYLDLARDKFAAERGRYQQKRGDEIAAALAEGGLPQQLQGHPLQPLAAENARRQKIVERVAKEVRERKAELDQLSIDEKRAKIAEIANQAKRDALRFPYELEQERGKADAAAYETWRRENPEEAAKRDAKVASIEAQGKTRDAANALAEMFKRAGGFLGAPPQGLEPYGNIMKTNVAAGKTPLSGIPASAHEGLKDGVRQMTWEQAMKIAQAKLKDDPRSLGMDPREYAAQLNAYARAIYNMTVKKGMDDNVGDHSKSNALDLLREFSQAYDRQRGPGPTAPSPGPQAVEGPASPPAAAPTRPAQPARRDMPPITTSSDEGLADTWYQLADGKISVGMPREKMKEVAKRLLQDHLKTVQAWKAASAEEKQRLEAIMRLQSDTLKSRFGLDLGAGQQE